MQGLLAGLGAELGRSFSLDFFAVKKLHNGSILQVEDQ